MSEGTMFAAERDRPDPIEFVSIVSPNHHHLSAARAALAAGVAVMSDKPMTATFAEAQELAGLVRASKTPYALSYTYSGYPLVREARARIAAGALGIVRKVVVEYPQGWLASGAVGKQAEWRVDPTRSGEGGCIGDIGVHAFHLAEFVTGLTVTELLADLAAVVPGRLLDDDCAVLLCFSNGARGVLLASQIEIGERNGLKLRVYGEKGGLVWRQEQPNTLTLHKPDGTTEIVHAGSSQLGEAARAGTRTRRGIPRAIWRPSRTSIRILRRCFEAPTRRCCLALAMACAAWHLWRPPWPRAGRDRVGSASQWGRSKRYEDNQGTRDLSGAICQRQVAVRLVGQMIVGAFLGASRENRPAMPPKSLNIEAKWPAERLG